MEGDAILPSLFVMQLHKPRRYNIPERHSIGKPVYPCFKRVLLPTRSQTRLYQDSGPSRHVLDVCAVERIGNYYLFTLNPIYNDAVQDVCKGRQDFSLLDVTAVHAVPHYTGFRCLAQVRLLLLLQRRLHRQG